MYHICKVLLAGHDNIKAALGNYNVGVCRVAALCEVFRDSRLSSLGIGHVNSSDLRVGETV